MPLADRVLKTSLVRAKVWVAQTIAGACGECEVIAESKISVLASLAGFLRAG